MMKVHLLLLLLALWKCVMITSAPVLTISTTNASYYFSFETKLFDIYRKEATSITSQAVFTWDVNYTISAQQSSNMPSVTATECTTEALIEMNITNTTNWQSTNVYEGTEVQSSSTDGSTFYPMCRFYPALIIPSSGPSTVTFSVIFFSCWAIGAVVVSIIATCVIRCRLRIRAKNIQIPNDTSQEVSYQTPTPEHYEAEIIIPIDA